MILINDIRLEMKGINKSFPGVHALKNVDFELKRGEIIGLLGENGAGKSTLMKVLGGIEIPETGDIILEGENVKVANPTEAQNLGISFIHQELSLFLDLDIASNIYMQDLPNKHNLILEKNLNANTKKVLKMISLDKHSPKELIKNLQMGERQLIEIARCLIMDTKVLVLDEPTSSLTKKEVEILFDLMRLLKEKGISIIFISHRMDEVFDICDRISVMRDGAMIATMNTKDVTTADVVKLMIGRELDDMFNREYAI